MKEYRLTDWLPTTKKEVELRGWDELDVILFSGDAYVDHPSFGAAVIGRILEAEGLKSKMILQVHDELIVESPESEAEAAAQILKEEMENAVSLSVPLIADAAMGKTWYDAKG